MIKSKLPIVETGKFGPVKLTSDKEFGKNNGENLKGAIFKSSLRVSLEVTFLHIKLPNTNIVQFTCYILYILRLRPCRRPPSGLVACWFRG